MSAAATFLCVRFWAPPQGQQEAQGQPHRPDTCTVQLLTWRGRLGAVVGGAGPDSTGASSQGPGSALRSTRTRPLAAHCLFQELVASAVAWRLEPEAKFTVCGIYKQPASRPCRSAFARTGPAARPSERSGPAGPVAGAPARVTGGPACGKAYCHGDSSQGRAQLQLPSIPGGARGAAGTVPFPALFSLCWDLDEQSLEAPPLSFLPVLEDIRVFKGCPEEVPLARPPLPIPATGRVAVRGQARGRPVVAGAAPVTGCH